MVAMCSLAQSLSCGGSYARPLRQRSDCPIWSWRAVCLSHIQNFTFVVCVKLLVHPGGPENVLLVFPKKLIQ